MNKLNINEELTAGEILEKYSELRFKQTEDWIKENNKIFEEAAKNSGDTELEELFKRRNEIKQKAILEKMRQAAEQNGVEVSANPFERLRGKSAIKELEEIEHKIHEKTGTKFEPLTT